MGVASRLDPSSEILPVMKPCFFLFALSLSFAGCSGGSGESAPSVSPGSTGESEPANPTAESDVPSDPGEAIYKTYCIVCHQADGSGKPAGGGGAIAGDFSASGTDAVLSKSDEDLLRSIKVGRSGTIGVMPKWMGILDKQERRDVLAYIRGAFGSPAPSSGAPEEVPKGTSPGGS